MNAPAQNIVADETPVQLWTADPEARAILAGFLTAQPVCRIAFTTYAQTRDERRVFEGEAVDRLRVIRERFLQNLIDTKQYEGFRGQPDVDQLIDDVLYDPSIVKGWMAEALDAAEVAQNALFKVAGQRRAPKPADFDVVYDANDAARTHICAMVTAMTGVDPVRLQVVLS